MDHHAPPTDYKADIDAVSRIKAVPTILDVVCRTTGMGFAAVARVTEGRWIACNVLDHIAFGLQPGGELDVETTICHEVREHREAVIIDCVAEDDQYRTHKTPAMYGFQSYISVPIVLPDGEFFGTLCAIDPKPNKLSSPEVISTFKLFAEMIAFHLDAYSRIAASEAVLLREREVSELREQFIAVLGHDLRNPLAAVQAGMRLLLRHPDRAEALAGPIERSIARMAALIDNVMDFARGRLGGGLTVNRAAPEPIGPTLQQVIDELQSTHLDRRIVADFDLRQDVSCDRGRLAQLFSNLLANAVTYGAPAEPVLVHAVADQGLFKLSVSNCGEPIPAAAIKSLFMPFFRAREREGQEGLGLGLYIAAEIAQAHGGRIDVTSDARETRFTLRMPA